METNFQSSDNELGSDPAPTQDSSATPANRQVVSNKKLIIIIVAVIILAILTIGFISAYWINSQISESKELSNTTPASSPTTELSTQQEATLLTPIPPNNTQTTMKHFESRFFGFSINIPSDWIFEETKDQINYPNDPNPKSYITFSSPVTATRARKIMDDCSDRNDLTPCPADAPPIDIYFSLASNIVPSNASTIKSNNIEWKRFEPIGSIAGGFEYQTTYLGKQYSFFVLPSSDQIFQEMLKSFQWTSSSVKTYTNTELGFSFQYPSDWYVLENNATYEKMCQAEYSFESPTNNFKPCIHPDTVLNLQSINAFCTKGGCVDPDLKRIELINPVSSIHLSKAPAQKKKEIEKMCSRSEANKFTVGIATACTIQPNEGQSSIYALFNIKGTPFYMATIGSGEELQIMKNVLLTLSVSI